MEVEREKGNEREQEIQCSAGAKQKRCMSVTI